MRHIQELLRDIRFGVRVLAKAPGNTAALILMLAIGIGGKTAVLTLADAFLSSSHGIDHPERLVSVFTSVGNARFGPSSSPDFVDWQRNNSSFEDLLAHALVGVSYRRSDRT